MLKMLIIVQNTNPANLGFRKENAKGGAELIVNIGKQDKIISEFEPQKKK